MSLVRKIILAQCYSNGSTVNSTNSWYHKYTRTDRLQNLIESYVPSCTQHLVQLAKTLVSYKPMATNLHSSEVHLKCHSYQPSRFGWDSPDF